MAGSTMTLWTITFATFAENARTLQNHNFEGNNFECNSCSSTANTALESWDRDRHVDVSTLEIH